MKAKELGITISVSLVMMVVVIVMDTFCNDSGDRAWAKRMAMTEFISSRDGFLMPKRLVQTSDASSLKDIITPSDS